MKRHLLIAAMFAAFANAQTEGGQVTQPELTVASQWYSAVTSKPAGPWIDGWVSTALPFSFKLEGKDSAFFLPSWRFEKTGDDVSWTDPATGLRVTMRLKRFTDYPAIDWVLLFSNTGSKDTPIIEDVQAMDMRLNHTASVEYVVHGAAGGRSFPDDMQPFSQVLPAEHRYIRQMQLGGDFPSSNRHLPFFNLETPDHRGVMVGIGWSGKWLARVRAEGTELNARAGLAKTHFVLHPGETIRTPRILVMFWEGKRLHGHNMFRQLLYAHYVPKLNGKAQQPLVTVNVCFTYHGYGGFLHDATAKTVSALIEPFGKLGSELMILDAGWYDGAPWNEWVGNWTYSRTKYPNGLQPISDALAKSGQLFGLWFASENVSDHAPVMKEHPEWLRVTPDRKNATLRMDLPEAREWFLKAVDSAVDREGVRCYRQDGSGSFGEDAEDRQGINESKHVAGLYEMWDELVRRHPGIIMEGCSGGGRRIDLETVSRFHWHQKSDRWYDSESDQLSLYGANLYLPGGTINIPTQRTDDYGAWSSFAGQFSLGWHPLDADFPMAQARKQVELYKRIRPALSGDFYPLTAGSLEDAWIGYQFHDAKANRGFALIFRRRASPSALFPVDDTHKIQLRGLDPKSSYAVRFESGAKEQNLAARQLASGLDIVLKNAPAAEMVVYEPR